MTKSPIKEKSRFSFYQKISRYFGNKSIILFTLKSTIIFTNKTKNGNSHKPSPLNY